jgi:alkanesulfonate monooxygenase SsuD/methylene tetrahydromethanopterin reductase-like flavin-dependent oxidoreductase (luciferase family)
MDASDLGIYLPPTVDRSMLVEVTRLADDAGFHSLWFNEGGLGRDPIVHAAAAAMVSDRLHLGIGVANIWKQLPAALAMAAATLATLAPGRSTLALGPWQEPDATEAGAARRRPVEAMREATAIARGLLRGETVTYTGELFCVEHASLGGAAPATPLLWGANGPQMVAAAAELASADVLDGVMVSYLHTAEQVAAIVDAVRTAATEAGRAPATLQFPVAVIVDLDEDEGRAVERMRSAIDNVSTLRAEAHLPTDRAVTAADIAARIVAGSPARCRDRLQDYLDAGAGPLALYAREPVHTLEHLFD